MRAQHVHARRQQHRPIPWLLDHHRRGRRDPTHRLVRAHRLSDGSPMVFRLVGRSACPSVRRGTARLVGTSKARIVSEASTLLCDPLAYERMTAAPNPMVTDMRPCGFSMCSRVSTSRERQPREQRLMHSASGSGSASEVSTAVPQRRVEKRKMHQCAAAQTSANASGYVGRG
jgi:hypothetical protein